jgi:hypothetical protein
MLTLEQVRAVNDGLSRGDWNAALQPLEEQIDLRHAELPKLEKTAVIALVKGLQSPETARFWADAVFAPNVSVRRFVRRTFLGIKEDLGALVTPLQSALEKFWASETPLPFSNSAKGASARREQLEMVQSAIEILLRCDPSRFMDFWIRLNDASRPARVGHEAERIKWQEQQHAYSVAYSAAMEASLTAQFGSDILDSHRRWQLPSRIWNEIQIGVSSREDIKVLLEAMGQSPWARAALEWQPKQLFQSALEPYMAERATGPQRKVASEIRTYLWNLVDAAFDENATEDERKLSGIRLRELLPSFRISNWLERKQMWEQLPALLQQWRPTVSRENLEETANSAWFGLVQMLLYSLHRPYNIEPKDWNPPAIITPELIRGWKIPELEGYGINLALENVACNLEQSVVFNEDSQDDSEVVEEVVSEDDFDLDLGYFPSEWRLAQLKKNQSAEDFQALLNRWREEKLQIIQDIKTTEDRVGMLLNPPVYVDKPIKRYVLWEIWSRDNANLKEQQWPLVSSQLWALYEEKLELYRRIESDEIAPELGSKLTVGELKEWKANERAAKRRIIANEIDDLTNLFRSIEDLEAEIKMLRLLERPGVRDLLKTQQSHLLARASNAFYHRNQRISTPEDDEKWLRENWFLDESWGDLLKELETALLGAKRVNDWEKQFYSKQFAIAHYRLKSSESRQKFLSLAREVDNLAVNLVIPVTFLNDIEAWLIILERMEWSYPEMRQLWAKVRAQNNKESHGLTRNVLQLFSTTTNDKAIKFQIELLDELTEDELEQHVEQLDHCLESALIPVKRWGLAKISKLGECNSDAAQLVCEMLWSENGALVKDAIKFLGAQQGENLQLAWEALQDGLTLENQPILELILRALATLKNKNKELGLSEASQERIRELAELAPARFGKLAKRLNDN